MIKNKGIGDKKGFTLIEVLIVVAIIAILSSVILIGLGPAQRAGRDSRRIADLRQTQSGLELYFNKCGYYPGAANAGNPPCAAYSAANSWAAMGAALTGSAIGVSAVPNDPTSGKSYLYGSTNGVSYTLGATLEDAANPALTQDVDGTSDGVTCTDPTYCVQL